MDEARSRWDNVPQALRALKRHYGTTDAQLADALGLSRQTVQNRLSGATAMAYPELVGFAAFFDVPEEVLYIGPDTAVRWVLDHPSDSQAVKTRNFLVGDWEPVPA